MKGLILSSLSILLISAVHAPTAKAEPVAIKQATAQSTSTTQLTPFTLVSLAHQGYFQPQGIPGHIGFTAAYQIGQITAEEIVQSAVNANRLSPQVLSDSEYLRAVEVQLNAIANLH
ncbi:MAG TPA: hypothetical protein DDZ80_24265 [Cyanobacteria bacterium UBA8803]|nr:hypothetical protein [Cyanobacteria bacterium UBA9273]HBL61428.1 hypothetical protein [Cyanobacteria bacterium UBA8803]